MPANPDPLFNEVTAAEYLSVPVTSLRKRRLYGQEPRFVKLGKSVRYRKSDLDRFIEAGVRTSTSQVA